MAHATPPTARFEAIGDHRLEEWDDVLWRSMGGLRTEPLASQPFHGRALFGTAGPVRLCEIHSSPAHVVRDRARGPIEDRDFLKIAIQLHGRTRFEQANREVFLEGAGWTLYDTSRPYTVANLTAVHQLVLLVPKAELAVSAHDIAHCSVRPMGIQGGIARMLPAYAHSLFAEQDSLGNDVRQDLGDMMAQLLRLSIGEQMHARPHETSLETLAFQMKQYIRRHLADAELSVQHLADRFGCTKRHLHRAFAAENLSLSEYILACRLDHGARLLSGELPARRSISEVALMSGFNNFAHFSRAFKARFGLTPRDFRADRLGGAASAID